MKVYVGYYYSVREDGGDTNILKVFDSEEKAKAWADDFKATYWEWREYDEYEVE